MNKLEGFYEMENLNIPTIPWKKYEPSSKLNSKYLWTIRSAVISGNDFSLKRLVGATAKEAKKFASLLLKEMHENDLVIYYPYFIADVSGTLEVGTDHTVIEAVTGDLSNLVDDHKLDTHLRYNISNQLKDCINPNFLTQLRCDELLKYASRLRGRKRFKSELLEGKRVLLEWSYAINCDVSRQPVDEPYLVFYEVRTV